MTRRQRRWPVFLDICIAASLAALLGGCSETLNEIPPLPDDPQGVVDEVRVRFGLPALAAAVIRTDVETEYYVSGIRRLGFPDEVALTDRFHLGGEVKSMTSTAIGKLVEDGRLSWETTVIEAFPELDGRINSIYHGVTVTQFLNHRAGLPDFNSLNDFVLIPIFTGSSTDQRVDFTEWLLARAAVAEPGVLTFSNAGFTVAAAIAERMTGTAWETLIDETLFAPLGIEAGEGWPAAIDTTQTWGHWTLLGSLRPHVPIGGYIVPFMLAPGLDVNMTLPDFAVYVRMHLRGLNGIDTILKAETIQRLHEPTGDFALGWTIFEAAGFTTSAHNGSAGTFDAYAVIQPARGLAIVVVTNAATQSSILALGEAATALADIADR